MAEAYVGQIEAFAFDFPPRGWAQCAGQTMAISQNQVLFALLGTTFGGDGRTTFRLPDLRGRLAIGQGTGSGLSPHVVGEAGGEEGHRLSVEEIPSHTHEVAVTANADTANNTSSPGKTVVLSKTTGSAQDGTSLTINLYAADANPNQPLAPEAVGITGGLPHENRMPYLGVNFCICLQGLFPPRN